MVTAAEAIQEGLNIASAAARLTITNRILVETIAGGADFDMDHFIDVARDTLLDLAAEQDEAAATMQRLRKIAGGRYTDPHGTHDYRDRDTRNLRLRHRQYVGVAKELRERADDEMSLIALVADAREAAWADVQRNLNRRLSIEAMRADADPDYGAKREARMSALMMIDLQNLEARQRALGMLPGGAGSPRSS